MNWIMKRLKSQTILRSDSIAIPPTQRYAIVAFFSLGV